MSAGYQQLARYYDALTQNVHYDKRAGQLDQLIRQYGQGGQGILLDLACGTGSLSVELSRLGYDVIGVDVSEAMLSQALFKASAQKQEILFLCQAMETLDLYGTVDICVSILDSLNHLPDEAALARAIARVALFLQEGGLFIFDVNTQYKHQHILGDNTFVYDVPEVFCVWRNDYRKSDDSVTISLDFFTPEKEGYLRFQECFTEHYFSDAILKKHLIENGFSICGMLDGDTLQAVNEKTQRCLYVVKLEQK